MVRCIISWGSYDESKPRVRLLLAELRKKGTLQAEINIPVWQSIRDKAMASRGKIAATLIRLLFAYPGAILRLIRQPGGAALLLPYPAIPDIFFAWPIARFRRHIIVFDAFISMHDTIVSDRGLVTDAGLASKVIWHVEKLALQLADIILVDTDRHGDFFSSNFSIPRERFQTVLVGAEENFWNARDVRPLEIEELPRVGDRPRVLFYGQLIPLQGVNTILEAIEITKDEPIDWLLVGSGQEEVKVRQFLAGYDRANVSWIPWVEYDRLPAYISAASVALGIFGTSDKASRVIPNKAYQIIAVGTPLITRSSPAMDSIAGHCRQAVITVPAGDAEALAAAVREAVSRDWKRKPVPMANAASLGPAKGVEELSKRVQDKPAKERGSTATAH